MNPRVAVLYSNCTPAMELKFCNYVKLELKTCPSVIAEVSRDAISANLTCHIFKISWGSMPPDPHRSPETFFSLLRGSEKYFRICCASVTIQAGSAPGIVFILLIYFEPSDYLTVITQVGLWFYNEVGDFLKEIICSK